MKVVFLENYSETGHLAGDIREVKNGFARNFLIPKKIALPATEKIIAGTEDLRKKGEGIRIEMKEAAKSTKSKLSGKILEISGKSDGDTLYASITEKIIADKIKSEFGIEMEEKFIKDGHIKTLGDHQILFQMNDGISFSMKLNVFDPDVKKTEVKTKKKEEKTEEKTEEIIEETKEKKADNSEKSE